MKKYLFIVLLFGFWSCEDGPEDCDNSISILIKAYADLNWSLSNWWNFTQSGASRLEYEGIDFTDIKLKEMRNYMGVQNLTLQLSGNLLSEFQSEFFTSDSLPLFAHYLSSSDISVVKDSNFYLNIGKYEQFLGGWSDASSEWYWGLELSDAGDTSYVTAKTPKQQQYLDMLPDCK